MLTELQRVTLTKKMCSRGGGAVLKTCPVACLDALVCFGTHLLKPGRHSSLLMPLFTFRASSKTSKSSQNDMEDLSQRIHDQQPAWLQPDPFTTGLPLALASHMAISILCLTSAGESLSYSLYLSLRIGKYIHSLGVVQVADVAFCLQCISEETSSQLGSIDQRVQG